jgi:hypothetical protein
MSRLLWVSGRKGRRDSTGCDEDVHEIQIRDMECRWKATGSIHPVNKMTLRA